MSVDATAISRALGITTKFFNSAIGGVFNLPQRIAVIGQGNTGQTYSNDPVEITSAGQAAVLFGYGSPLHLAIKELFPPTGQGVGSIPVTAYPLDDAGTAVVATGAIGAAGTMASAKTYSIYIGRIKAQEVTIPASTVAADALALIKTAISAVLDMPVNTGTIAAGSLPITSKWKGQSANDIVIEIVGEVDSGLTFTITQPTGGATNPDIDDALNLIGSKWETIILNCLNYDDTATLGKVSTFGDARWGTLEYKPLFCVYGTKDDYAARSAITDARKADKTNVIIPVIGCNNLPFVIAGAAVNKIAVGANNDPASNYSDYLTTLTPGSYAVQENSPTRNLSISKGSSDTILNNGYVQLNDTVTFYHPDNEVVPGYRYVCDLIKLMVVIFNLKVFEESAWKGCPLLPDSTPTTNAYAKKPKDVKTVLGNLADNLALQAIISDPEYTQKNMSVGISSTNPKRIDIVFPIKLSGNIEVNSIDLNFGFYFGGA